MTLVTALQASASRALAPLRQEACAALRVVARDGQLLRVVPPACGQRGVSWVSLAEVPAVLRDAVVVAEDQRFLWHPGVDGLALARAALQDVLARRRVSGASTITMQLMRMLHHAGEPRTLGNKLSEIWLALAAERGASKHEILEAYLNTAYYGHGAYGLASAAQLYFGKSVRALSDSEALLLAVLPRAPSAYDPLLHAPAALARRGVLLAALVRAGRLGQAQAHELAAQTPHVELHAVAGASEAPHFVDWVVDSLPAAERRAGGELVTTLDLALQRQLERVVREQVMRLSEHGVTQAGVVVLDTQTSEVRAMVGSVDYAASQLNLTLRRRHPGSLLKPFVYALAIEAGARPGSLIYDVGDVPSQFHARDWVEHEGGVLPMREALAGSYNLAAVHALENVGVGKLRERLRELGVAELEQAPDRYGLQLALGSARVRLLDATAGFGFMVRGGSVREARAVRELRRAGHAVYAPVDAGERRGFSPEVSWLVMQMLSEPDNRHGRFGRGLPVEGSDATGAGTRVVAKTGTASGMSDMTTVLATREFLVGAWSGRLDGAPARGTSGMWSAAPLARLALDTALQGNTPSLPERPSGVRSEALCAISGLAAQPACPHTLHSFALASMPETKPCDWHRAGDSELHAPAELQAWLTRARARGPRLDLH
ncbi:MAG TPA: transglycosylase domain-containing protein [Polyangiales bacterium]|nr:transglycosylase domain-containing protein [Polyangiales bacterium]